MKNFIKKYGSVILSVALIVAALKYNAVLNTPAPREDSGLLEPFNPETQNKGKLSPDTPYNGQPQFPILFTSSGGITADVVHNTESLYGNVAVYDYGGNIRSLSIDGTLACTYNFKQAVATAHVHEMAEIVKNYAPENSDILLVGMGCGGFLKELSGTGHSIDVVEINPEVVSTAEKFFVMPDDLNYKTYVDDGLHFLKNTDKKYDAIIVDLCDILDVNAHLYTKEFYKLAKTKFKNENSFLMQSLNIYRAGDPNRLDHKMANTMGDNFEKVFHTGRTEGEQYFDVLNLIATDVDMNSVENMELLPWEFESSYGVITEENAIQTSRQHLPALNALRRQSIENYGFNIPLK